MSAPSVSLVIPLFNEERRLARTGPQIAEFIQSQEFECEVVLVDDGSTDGTVDVAHRLLADYPDCQIRILRAEHRGKGAAIRSGLGEATNEVAAFCDVDLATPLAEVFRLVEVATVANVMVIGSRGVGSASLIRRQSRARELLGKGFNRYVQLLIAPGITDTQCGAKAARREVWKSVLAHSIEDGFSWDLEIIGIARRLGIGIREVGVRWSHDEDSRVHVVRDGLRMAIAALRITGRLARIPRSVPDQDVTLEGTLLEAGGPEHWWFRSKAAYVSRAINRHGRSSGVLLDVGAGTGGVTSMLGWRPEDVFVVEPSDVLASEAFIRYGLLAVRGSAGRLPTADRSASVVSLLDVIEHLEDPMAALREAKRVVESTGIVVVTVPAHMWLWSDADEALGHYRRYTVRGLRNDLESVGFEVKMITHTFAWLVVPVLVVRRLGRGTRTKLGLERRSALISSVALVLQRIENALMRWVRLPVGTSILAVAAPVDGGSTTFNPNGAETTS